MQFLDWKRRLHGLIIWFFKSLTFCFCLYYNQKTALVYLSKGVSFLKKSPGTNGLRQNSLGLGNMLKKIFVVFIQDGYLFLLFLSTFTPSHWQWKIYFCCWCCRFFLGTLQQFFEIENISLFNYFFQMKSLYQFIASTSHLREPPFSQFPPQVNTQSCTSNKVSTQTFNPLLFKFLTYGY